MAQTHSCSKGGALFRVRAVLGQSTEQGNLFNTPLPDPFLPDILQHGIEENSKSPARENTVVDILISKKKTSKL